MQVAKVCDFGFAVRCGGGRCSTVCGTPVYMAPELNKTSPSYLGPPVDCWALGALVFELLEGRAAFSGTSAHQLVQRIRNVSHEPYRSGASRDAKALVKGLLHGEPSTRATASELLDHRWFHEEVVP